MRAETVGFKTHMKREPGGGHTYRLTTSISRSRRLDTYALMLNPLPPITTQNGYSPPGVPGVAPEAAWPGRRSSSKPWNVPTPPCADWLVGDHWLIQAPKPPVKIVIES